jgi:hypothetical protein
MKPIIIAGWLLYDEVYSRPTFGSLAELASHIVGYLDMQTMFSVTRTRRTCEATEGVPTAPTGQFAS